MLYKVILTSQFVDEILKCDHLNEVVLPTGTNFLVLNQDWRKNGGNLKTLIVRSKIDRKIRFLGSPIRILCYFAQFSFRLLAGGKTKHFSSSNRYL